MLGRIRGYAICATPRSGSNYLARLLISTGALGRPLEYFDHGAIVASGWPRWPTEPLTQLELVPSIGGSPNGVYGLKVFPHHFAAAPWARTLPRLSFVHLTRRDVVGQAISWVRARQTQAWTSNDRAAREPRYDADAIAGALDEICDADARWRRWFAINRLDPLRLAYEDVCASPEGAVELVRRLMDVPGQILPDCDLIDVARQRDEISEAWAQAWLAERGVLDAF